MENQRHAEATDLSQDSVVTASSSLDPMNEGVFRAHAPTPPDQSDSTAHAMIEPRARPDATAGFTERITTGCGKLYVTLNRDDHGFCEVFVQMGKAGGCGKSQVEASGRLISLALRSGVKIESIIRQLRDICCPISVWQNGCQVLSCSDAIARVLDRHVGGGSKKSAKHHAAIPATREIPKDDRTSRSAVTPNSCPDCDGTLQQEEGCAVCHSCGFSRCG